MKVRIRDNADPKLKCRCGLPFMKVMVVSDEQGQRWLPFFCERCDTLRASQRG